MQFEEKILISAPPETVFALYADVKNWPAWDPDTQSAVIHGDFVPGATGVLKPRQGPPAKITFTQVVPNRLFTVESKLPGCILRFEHELSVQAGQTQAMHRVSFTGWLAPLFGRLIGAALRRGLPNTLQGLKRAAEQNKA
jgi:uncharacterized protein YndB with AHSA1/START domain